MMMESAWSVLATIAVIVGMHLLTKLWRRAYYYEPNLVVLDANSSHHWEYTDMILHLPLHCNVCHTFLLTSKGQFCSNCGIGCCVQTSCVKKANATHKCKEIAVEAAEVTKFRHHWIGGNLPLHSECEVCEECCGDGPGIIDLRCCWCQRTVHNHCQPQLGEVCDMGEFNQLIVPPYCVKAKLGRTVRHPKRRVVSEVTAPGKPSKWHPLIVIGNRKSGNNDCASILASFRGHLNPAQVTDLDDAKMEDALKWCQLVTEHQCFCLVAGGDGTIGWVLNTIDTLDIGNPPPLALLPLGTGNDLARSLGYGPGVDSSVNIREVMRKMQEAKVVQLDRWKIVVNPFRHFGIQLPSTTFHMQNYVSIGVDALVTYNFHRARESPFYLISSRIINKLIYFSYGTKDVLERECKNLDQILELYMDDERVELPNVESVVVLNIPCWGAGVRPWTLGSGHEQFPIPSLSDGKLEVFCVYSSFHIAQMQVGLSEPHRMGQAKSVRLRLTGSAPMQVDGEPWEQHPAEIIINHHKQIPIFSFS